MIWNVADMLRGPFKPHEYGLVILPMTVVKRFHDCLLPTHAAVQETYGFEDLVRRFSESFGEEAGAHFTSRDIIYLMTDLLLSNADLSDTGNITVYDMAMGTSQMLSCMEERIHELNSETEVTCFGQEFNPSTFAIAKADMMFR
jgi:type I restriction enzyme M protein